MANRVDTDFTTVTETWGLSATREQLEMQYCRYRMTGDLAVGKELLEVGCGSGMGLSYLATRAKRAVGIEFTPALVDEARRHLPGVEVIQGDAQSIPFPDRSFDMVAMLEMIYYVRDANLAFAEARRLLRPDGILLVCEPNPERPDFNPSPFAVRYFTATELASTLLRNGFTATVYGGFPLEAETSRDRVIRPIRGLAVKWRLVPRTMRMKAIVKRVLYGQLPRLGAVRDGMTTYRPPTAFTPDGSPERRFKNLYAVASPLATTS